jgi:Ricin-type beta-trefoil lectin domain-like
MLHNYRQKNNVGLITALFVTMETRTLRQIGWVSASLGLTTILVGCGEMPESDAGNDPSQGAALATTNGLAAVNGLSSTNGLSLTNGLASVNGLALANGLASVNGLSSTNGLMTTADGRRTISYLARCALNNGDSLVKADQTGTNYTFAGAMGLCPQWKSASVATDWQCQEYLSACMMAHLNTAGIHIPLWLDADPSKTKVGWGTSTSYPKQEGSFFGNIMTTGLIGHGTVAAPKGYYCDGAGFTGGASGVAAGRINAGGTNVPYSNPFGDGVLCKNTSGVTANWTSGGTEPDGYTQLIYGGTPWNNVLTVWRASSYTAAFDTGYKYSFYALSTRANPMLIDVTGGVTTDGAKLQQWAQSAALDSSKFSVLASGSYWKIVMKANANECLDAGAGTNGTIVTTKTCNGSTAQQWSFSMDGGYGSAFIKNVASGRCLDSMGAAQGTGVDVYDCAGSSGSWQEFRIVATQ